MEFHLFFPFPPIFNPPLFPSPKETKPLYLTKTKSSGLLKQEDGPDPSPTKSETISKMYKELWIRLCTVLRLDNNKRITELNYSALCLPSTYARFCDIGLCRNTWTKLLISGIGWFLFIFFIFIKIIFA